MKIEHVNSGRVFFAVAGVMAVLFSQAGCRRASEEKPAVVPEEQAERPVVQVEEAQPSAVVAPVATGESADVSVEIEECKALIRDRLSKISQLHKQIAAARKRSGVDSPEIVAMAKEVEVLKKALSEREGTKEQVNHRTALQQKIDE